MENNPPNAQAPNVQMPVPKRRSNKLWVMLIIAPFVLLLFTALLQIIVHFLANGSPSGPFIALINVISALLGMAAVILIICLPIWIIMLIRNSKPSKNT